MALRREKLVESVAKKLDLTVAEAQALATAGRALSPISALRSEVLDGDTAEVEDESTLISCVMSPGGVWRITVADAIGLIVVGDLQLITTPKIPPSHLFYLFAEAELIPRIAPSEASAAAGTDLWQLVCRWLVEAAERVLRRDLARDYLPIRDRLEVARGQIDALASGEEFYRGSLHLVCDFEEFGEDTELNRVLRAALITVASSTEAASPTRRRAMATAARMYGVGPLRSQDMRVQLDRRTAHYRDALLLSRAVLANIRRALVFGDDIAWSFLIRTPDLVEEGIRKILRSSLGEPWNVRKRTIPLTGAGMSVAPDLIFGAGHAVGDVKYKRTTAKWRRPDLYEVTTFAVAADTPRAAIIGFRVEDDPPAPPVVTVGETEIRFFAWDAREGVAPEVAAAKLVSSVQAWLGAVPALGL